MGVKNSELLVGIVSVLAKVQSLGFVGLTFGLTMKRIKLN
jgi:hypothetical protein